MGREWEIPKLSAERLSSMSPAEFASLFYKIRGNTLRCSEDAKEVLTAAYCHMLDAESYDQETMLWIWRRDPYWETDYNRFRDLSINRLSSFDRYSSIDRYVPSSGRQLEITAGKRQIGSDHKVTDRAVKRVKLEVRSCQCCMLPATAHFFQLPFHPANDRLQAAPPLGCTSSMTRIVLGVNAPGVEKLSTGVEKLSITKPRVFVADSRPLSDSLLPSDSFAQTRFEPDQSHISGFPSKAPSCSALTSNDTPATVHQLHPLRLSQASGIHLECLESLLRGAVSELAHADEPVNTQRSRVKANLEGALLQVQELKSMVE
jgi:hypothetical protein